MNASEPFLFRHYDAVQVGELALGLPLVALTATAAAAQLWHARKVSGPGQHEYRQGVDWIWDWRRTGDSRGR